MKRVTRKWQVLEKADTETDQSATWRNRYEFRATGFEMSSEPTEPQGELRNEVHTLSYDWLTDWLSDAGFSLKSW